MVKLRKNRSKFALESWKKWKMREIWLRTREKILKNFWKLAKKVEKEVQKYKKLKKLKMREIWSETYKKIEKNM